MLVAPVRVLQQMGLTLFHFAASRCAVQQHDIGWLFQRSNQNISLISSIPGHRFQILYSIEMQRTHLSVLCLFVSSVVV